MRTRLSSPARVPPRRAVLWIQYDYVRLEALDGGGNTAPVLSSLADEAIDERRCPGACN
ncbi:MAG: hypothetical protein KF791_07770 [Verrucomicrobiae bacterium]|nr:hypothetical protein [Verrucomicrobiae bacterium]